MTWAHGKMVGLDLETTGVDIETDRMVTATLIVVEPGGGKARHSWIVDPGVDIPEAAAELHGVTTERARREGMPPAEALGQMAALLQRHWTPEVPLVAYNGSYDLSIYDRELIRYEDAGLDIAGRCLADPLVMDRELDRYRKGGRKLDAVCAHYGVELVDAHTSDADTLAALRVAYKIAARYPRVGGLTLAELAAAQPLWHARWARRLAGFLRGEATKMENIWPLAATRDSARRWIEQKLSALDIAEPPSAELIAATVAGTRERADSIADSATDWPMRRRPALID